MEAHSNSAKLQERSHAPAAGILSEESRWDWKAGREQVKAGRVKVVTSTVGSTSQFLLPC